MATNLAVDVMSREKGGHGGLVINVASAAGDLFIFISFCALHGKPGGTEVECLVNSAAQRWRALHAFRLKKNKLITSHATTTKSISFEFEFIFVMIWEECISTCQLVLS